MKERGCEKSFPWQNYLRFLAVPVTSLEKKFFFAFDFFLFFFGRNQTHTMGHFICMGPAGGPPYYDLPFGPKC